jgi:hypothetical protein
MPTAENVKSINDISPFDSYMVILDKISTLDIVHVIKCKNSAIIICLIRSGTHFQAHTPCWLDVGWDWEGRGYVCWCGAAGGREQHLTSNTNNNRRTSPNQEWVIIITFVFIIIIFLYRYFYYSYALILLFHFYITFVIWAFVVVVRY